MNPITVPFRFLVMVEGISEITKNVECSFSNCSEYMIPNFTGSHVKTYKGNNTSCNSRSVEYCVTCDQCGMQYVGMTTYIRRIKDRITEYINNITDHR
ncbi:hypothetical protein V3C99_018670, partial [Haemonchus contortus]